LKKYRKPNSVNWNADSRGIVPALGYAAGIAAKYAVIAAASAVGAKAISSVGRNHREGKQNGNLMAIAR